MKTRTLFFLFIVLPIPVAFVAAFRYHPVNDGFIYFSLRWVLAPSIVLAGLVFWRAYGRTGRWSLFRVGLGAVITGIFVAFLVSASYVPVVNALTTFRAPRTVTGTVVEKWGAFLRGANYVVIVRDDRTGELLKFPVMKEEWQSARTGQAFSQEVITGGLGIRYLRASPWPWRAR